MKYLRPLKKEKLQPEERAAMRHVLQDTIQKNPLPISLAPTRGIHSHIVHPFTQTIKHLIPKPMFATIFLAILIALGGGTAAAAENATPGDALYPFKIHVNESIRGAAAVGAGAEADWQSTRAVRRLEEIAHLAAEGRLDTETREDLRAKFATHQEKAERLLADLSAKGKIEAAAKVSSHIDANLASYNDVLTSLKKSRPASVNALENIQNEVKEELDQAAVTRVKIEALYKEKTEHAAEGKMKAAKNKIEEVKKYIENKKEEAGTEAIAQAQAELKLSEEKYAQAIASFEKKSYGEAFVQFQQAHMLAERAKLTFKTIHKLNISFSGSDILEDEEDKNKQDEKKHDDNDDQTASLTAPTPTSSLKAQIKTRISPLKVELKQRIDAKEKDSDEKDHKQE